LNRFPPFSYKMEKYVSEQTRRKGEMVKDNSAEAQKKQAERSFKQEERARDGQKAMAEYEVQARATRAKTERLKVLRLAKRRRRSRSRHRSNLNAAPPAAGNNSSLHLAALHQSYAVNSAPPLMCMGLT
jgi:hypothetical protein